MQKMPSPGGYIRFSNSVVININGYVKKFGERRDSLAGKSFFGQKKMEI